MLYARIATKTVLWAIPCMGVHRDDLEMLIDGYLLKREGSQGQSKTYVLAMKLAQFDFLKRTASKTTPLLLLDDILISWIASE